MTLAVERLEVDASSSNLPVRSGDSVWLHGFTQTARSWIPVLDRPPVADQAGRRFLVDLPGHGSSSQATGGLWDGARDVITALEVAACERAVLVGYSLGGRLAMHMALLDPHRFEGIVLIGATPGLTHDEDRRARRESDARLAEHITAVGVDDFLDEWLAQPLFSGLDPHSSGREERRRNTAAGLASSLVHHGTGTQEDLRSRLGELGMPVLVMAGERDSKFVAAGAEIAEAWGGPSEISIVPGAGHAAHLEAPGVVADVIGTWWAQLDSSDTGSL